MWLCVEPQIRGVNTRCYRRLKTCSDWWVLLSYVRVGLRSKELGEWSALNRQRSLIVYYPQPYCYSMFFYLEVGGIRFFYQGYTESHPRILQALISNWGTW
jgi:hypothetical protein